MTLSIRPELPSDAPALRDLLARAFGGREEADLVDALRRLGIVDVALVALVEGDVTGYIAFSPVSVEVNPRRTIVSGLAPLAVAPDGQRGGIGSRLVWDGLAACRRRGVEAVVVLGESAYYERFGFRRADRSGLRCEYDAPPEAFMVLELADGAVDGLTGLVRYAPPFAAV